MFFSAPRQVVSAAQGVQGRAQGQNAASSVASNEASNEASSVASVTTGAAKGGDATEGGEVLREA